MEALFRKNKYAALAHAGSFLLVIVIFNYYSESKKHAKAQTFRYAIPNPSDYVGGTSQCNSTNELLDQSAVAGRCQTDSKYAPPIQNGSFNVIYGTLMFFLITAFAHLFYATDGFGSGRYSEVISEGWNPYRWVEYAASASIMIVLIANQLGVKDRDHLLSFVFMNFALQACGFLVENALISPLKSGGINTTTINGATAIGWCLLIGTWIPILYAFSAIYNDINKNYSTFNDPDTGDKIKIPGFVWFILIVQILNFSCFGFIQLGQIKDAYTGTLKPFEVYESKYLTLSFAGKLGLASGLAYGLLFRTKGCP